MQYIIAITLLLAPTYVIRFHFFGFPTNMLMVWIALVWILFAYWIYNNHVVRKFFQFSLNVDRKLRWLVGMFFLAGVLSLFVGGVTQGKVGQFVVLFVQPISLFFITRFVFASLSRSKELVLYAAFLFVAIAGVLAVIQYTSLLGLPEIFWGNSNEPKRAVSLFSHPNFYALFVAPLLAFLSSSVVAPFLVKDKGFRIKDFWYVCSWLLGAVGLLLSMSRGGWLGLAVAATVYVLALGNRRLLKVGLVTIIVMAIAIFSVPNFRYRVLLPFHGEKSSVARFSLWRTGSKMIQDNPVLGKGLLGFSNNWYGYNTDPGLEHYPAPHNIVLNFWVDTGILGLVSFFGICLVLLARGFHKRSSLFAFGVALFVVALSVHGLVDNPYFKNDLAMLVWLVAAFA